MPGALKKKSSKTSKGSKAKGSKGKKKKGSSSSKKGSRHADSAAAHQNRDVDMLDAAAMYNLYYIAHGPVEALEIRGFGWAAAPKKKGKKGKKGKK